MGIKNILKKIKKQGNNIMPIIDTNIYENDLKGFAGGSLEDQNVLVVSNYMINKELLDDIEREEKCHLKYLILFDNVISEEKLIKCSADLLGPFTHIINIIKATNENSFGIQNIVYQWLQIEADYFIKNLQYATLCTALIEQEGNSAETKSKLYAARTMIHGVGLVLSRHNIVANGLYVVPDATTNAILRTSIFLSSKYGQILAGEIVEIGGQSGGN